MYVEPNFKTKKALREAIRDGKDVKIFQPGPYGGNEPQTGRVSVEGPHFPKPHSWYAQVTLEAGRVVRIS